MISEQQPSMWKLVEEVCFNCMTLSHRLNNGTASQIQGVERGWKVRSFNTRTRTHMHANTRTHTMITLQLIREQGRHPKIT
jgi:hypothetical protein